MGIERRTDLSPCADVGLLYRTQSVTEVPADLEYGCGSDGREPGACISYPDVYDRDAEAADRSGVFVPDCVQYDRERSAGMVLPCLYRRDLCGYDLLAGSSLAQPVR